MLALQIYFYKMFQGVFCGFSISPTPYQKFDAMMKVQREQNRTILDIWSHLVATLMHLEFDNLTIFNPF